MISYVTGDATEPQGPGPKVIAHIVNDEGRWGSGFVVALSRRWREPEEHYRMWCQVPTHLAWCQGEGLPQLGNIQVVGVEHDIAVANMMAQHGVRRSATAPRAVDYQALKSCLHRLGDATVVYEQHGIIPSIHMPRIGCGLGGGDWAVVEPLIQSTLVDEYGLTVKVYDLVSA